jgi:hypothetical protein
MPKNLVCIYDNKKIFRLLKGRCKNIKTNWIEMKVVINIINVSIKGIQSR